MAHDIGDWYKEVARRGEHHVCSFIVQIVCKRAEKL
jgi:hypothetical protein